MRRYVCSQFKKEDLNVPKKKKEGGKGVIHTLHTRTIEGDYEKGMQAAE